MKRTKRFDDGGLASSGSQSAFGQQRSAYPSGPGGLGNNAPLVQIGTTAPTQPTSSGLFGQPAQAQPAMKRGGKVKTTPKMPAKPEMNFAKGGKVRKYAMGGAPTPAPTPAPASNPNALSMRPVAPTPAPTPAPSSAPAPNLRDLASKLGGIASTPSVAQRPIAPTPPRSVGNKGFYGSPQMREMQANLLRGKFNKPGIDYGPIPRQQRVSTAPPSIDSTYDPQIDYAPIPRQQRVSTAPPSLMYMGDDLELLRPYMNNPAPATSASDLAKAAEEFQRQQAAQANPAIDYAPINSINTVPSAPLRPAAYMKKGGAVKAKAYKKGGEIAMKKGGAVKGWGKARGARAAKIV